jgi:hypothetical protein
MVGRHGGDNLSDADLDEDSDGILRLKNAKTMLFRRNSVRRGRKRVLPGQPKVAKATLRVARCGRAMPDRGSEDVFIRHGLKGKK